MLSLSFSSGNTRLFLGHREMFNVCKGLLESWLKEMSDQGPCIDGGGGGGGGPGGTESLPTGPLYLGGERGGEIITGQDTGQPFHPTST